MRVAIIGSRDYADLPRVRRFVAALARKYPGAIVVSGGARGVDETAEEAAQENGLGVISYRPIELPESPDLEKPDFRYTVQVVTERIGDYRLGESRLSPPVFRTFAACAMFRNAWIVEDADQVVAFWDGKSRGTQAGIDNAKAAGKEPWIYR